MILALLLSIGFPLFFLYLVWLLELYNINQVNIVLTAVIWGILIVGIAYVIQSTLVQQNVLAMDELRVMVAPLLEELLKILFLVWLISHSILRYPIEGTTAGFAIGTGFAMAENILYISQNTDNALSIALIRVVSTGFMHPCTGAVFGTIIGSHTHASNRTLQFWIMLGFLYAVGIHAIYNYTLLQQTGKTILLAGVSLGALDIGLVFLLLHRMLKNEQLIIAGELADTLNTGELAATLDPEAITRLLKGQRQVLLPEQIEMIQHYISLQAQRAILNRAMLLNQRPGAQPALERQAQHVTLQLEALQNSMGLYTRLWLMTVLPSEEHDIWTHLEQDIKARQPSLALLVELTHRHAGLPPEEIARRKAALHNSDLFHGFRDNELEDIALLMQEKVYHTGEKVLEYGQLNHFLHCVASGELNVQAFQENKQKTETILVTLRAGDTFGELSMLDMAPTSATVTCLSEATIHQLSRADFMTLLHGKPDMAMEVIRKLVSDVRRQTSFLIRPGKKKRNKGD